MKALKIATAVALSMCVGAAGMAQTPTRSRNSNSNARIASKTDTTDVQHVIDAYHAAVHTHDGERLSGLFLPQASLWLSVLTDDAYTRTRAARPDAQRLRVGSYMDFANLVADPKVNLSPTQTDVRINTDGTIASVYFNFAFLVDGNEQNRGSESWVLVKGEDGWRIASLVYSSTPSTP